MARKRALRAIDVYSGVGGWGVGLQMAGINVVASYERWAAANETNTKNNRHRTRTVDIRNLSLRELPDDIDIVVGSPPCTQFSYSNRGGSGDIDDGLEDIIKFLTIVNHIKPKAWAMENVPRVAHILEKELKPKGRLARFANLGIRYTVLNMEEFGLPQRRRRCIAGNFDHAVLASYAKGTTKLTLGDVIAALSGPTITDPLYGLTIGCDGLYDHVAEDHLSEEELRINRAGKLMHPVYNSMPFPDPLNRTVRTITATCTRVSRESIIIEDPLQPEKFRRLTIRERACLQGFPITFQFYAASYGLKAYMVGNAIPPLFAYYVAHALRGTPAEKVPSLTEGVDRFKPPADQPTETTPDRVGARYPWERTFRFAIPNLRLKSGVRCEFGNIRKTDAVGWQVTFIFGTPKSIHKLPLDAGLSDSILASLPDGVAPKIRKELKALSGFIRAADVDHMQDLWSHRGPGGIRPLMMLDEIDNAASRVIPLLSTSQAVAQRIITETLQKAFRRNAKKLAGVTKLAKNAPVIVAGMLIGSVANAEFMRHGTQVHPDLRRRAPKMRVRGALRA